MPEDRCVRCRSYVPRLDGTQVQFDGTCIAHEYALPVSGDWHACEQFTAIVPWYVEIWRFVVAMFAIGVAGFTVRALLERFFSK